MINYFFLLNKIIEFCVLFGYKLYKPVLSYIILMIHFCDVLVLNDLILCCVCDSDQEYMAPEKKKSSDLGSD